jgi:hypothetical protein
LSTADGLSDKVFFRDVVIVGGGCYGTFYAGQLVRAASRAKTEFRRLLVVDRDPNCRFARELGSDGTQRLVVQDWATFFDEYLADREPQPPDAPPDAIVPSPLMPHLMYEWLIRRARDRWPQRVVETRPVPMKSGLPYDMTAPEGTRYVSYADWICPTHCIEPAVCPVIRAPRTWEMAEAMAQLTRRLDRSSPTTGPVLFVCRHRVFGVGMFDVAEVLAGNATVAYAGASGSPVDVLIGTISSCHGAVNLLHLGRGNGPDSS